MAMPEQWRKRSHQAFRFWHQLLAAWDDTPGASGQYGALTAHLKRFETRSTETFKQVITRGADPVYILHVLIILCDEARVQHAIGLPQVMTQEKSGSLSDPRDFHLVTESDLRTIEAAVPTFAKAGLPVDQATLQDLRRRFDTMPDPPDHAGYIGEKASLSTTFHLETPAPPPQRGRPGEHWFNTAMVLLARHLERTAPHPGARYTSIAFLLNAFCPITFDPSPLNRDTVRHRISFIQQRVTTYCEFFESWFDEWQRFLHRHPTAFNPWHT
jgi:hypothetical protein